MPPDPPGYQAALHGAVYYLPPQPGCLRLGDHDRSAFLQRQTTNDVDHVGLGHSVVTVLVSPTGRLLDGLRLLPDSDTILALTLPGHAPDTARYLQKRIFFNDKVWLQDASAEYAQVDLEGPRAGEVLLELGLPAIPDIDGIAQVEIDGTVLRVIGQRGLVGTGWRLLMPIAVLDGVLSRLAASGAEELSAEGRHVLRVEAGLPEAGAELVEAYTPLEVGLEHAVSGSKGCYTGQEVLARQVTYDKVTQHLARLQADAPLSPGVRLLADGKPVGVVTSAAVSPRFGPLALGVVKRPYHEPGSKLTAAEAGDVRVVVW